ncbi:SEFIR domain-containing protein [Amycolatopsis cihanbeyliensis]|uniref:SEFIR domain-containing protein n=1 Tax=Amycolatopsis cihanbeyliensis TaxID=1128664 RepID=UPI0014776562|nr:SEFIR domain-containing protein [Amycolatopsis cihanbeyliensis]
MREPDEAAVPPRVFVSFARDSVEHETAARDFATFLRTDAGVDARIEEWFQAQRRDRVAWALQEIDEADFIVVIASPAYKRVLDKAYSAAPGQLTHVEAAMIRNILARGPEEDLGRILPVVLPCGDPDDLPEVLRPYSTTSYAVPEINLAGLGELLHVLTGSTPYPLPPLGPYFPPLPPEQSIVLATPAPPAAPDGVIAAGAEVRIGGSVYLVQGDLESEPVADHAAVRSQGRALRLDRSHEHVWLRQVALRHDTSAAKDEIAALGHERDLLVRLRGKDRGLPSLVQLAEDGHVTTLVTAWPVSGDPGDPCGTLADFVPRPGEMVDSWHALGQLRALGGLARSLSVLHATRHTHRRLTPAGVLRLDDRTFVLRDLGDAGRGERPGEVPPDYRASEQERRHGGRAGPWTDVFRLAAIAYHLVTSHPPDPGTPLPIHALAPRVPARAATAIDAALACDAARRPGMDELETALRG